MHVTAQRFEDRAQAGRQLAERLQAYAGRDDVLALGLTRGGAAAAAALAQALDVPFDVLLVRRLQVPGHEELPLGAVASTGVVVLDRRAARELNLSLDALDALVSATVRDLDRQARSYRGERPPPDVAGQVAILVDDAVVSGDRMRAAVRAVRAAEPARVVVAVPVASARAAAELRALADEAVCLGEPERLGSPDGWYEEPGPPEEAAVRALLARAKPPPASGLAEALRPLTDDAYSALLERAAQADFVLIGEASHGTHEFYAERAELTKRLIAEAGFAAVAVEADWPDAARVDRYVRGRSDDGSPDEALMGFRRFPTWMWRNTVVRDFVGWLREHNDARAEQAGFYGLDLYSLHASMDAVIAYLEHVDHEAAARARERYFCFDHFGREPQHYGYDTALGGAEPCEQAAVDVLLELRERRAAEDSDDAFFAERNAELVVDAEEYYREMFRSSRESWNLRDRHMAKTLDALVARVGRAPEPVKVVVWAHNSHLGDARGTEMSQRG